MVEVFTLAFLTVGEKSEDKGDQAEDDEVDPLDAFMLELNKDKIIEADDVSDCVIT